MRRVSICCLDNKALNRSVLCVRVGQSSDGRNLPLYPTTVFTNSNLLVRSVNAGVMSLSQLTMKLRFTIRTALFLMALACLSIFVYTTFFLNRLIGEPAWFAAGQNVYHYGDIESAQKEQVSFSANKKWFDTIPKRPWGDIPTLVNGTNLDLDANLSSDGQLNLTVTLNAATKLQRRYEHRYNNLFPILFAIFVDGNAVGGIDPGGLSKSGGATQFRDLLDAGESRTWNISVDPKSLANFIPDENVHKVTLVAAFCERAHETNFDSGRLLQIAGYNKSDPSLLVRSHPASFRWPKDSN